MSIVALSSTLSKRYEPPKNKKILHIARDTRKALKEEGMKDKKV